jgi:hypothetical protein
LRYCCRVWSPFPLFHESPTRVISRSQLTLFHTIPALSLLGFHAVIAVNRVLGPSEILLAGDLVASCREPDTRVRSLWQIQVDSRTFERTADWWMFGWLPEWRSLLPGERTPEIRWSSPFPISSRPRTHPTPLRGDVVTRGEYYRHLGILCGLLESYGEKGWPKEGGIRASGNCVKSPLEGSSLVTTVKISAAVAVARALFLPLPSGIHRILSSSQRSVVRTRDRLVNPNATRTSKHKRRRQLSYTRGSF